MIAMIAAVDLDGAISKSGVIPWRIPRDLKWFKYHTLENTVVMGRKTFESIGCALSGRTNIILSKNTSFEAAGCIVMRSVEEVLSIQKIQGNLFIIGGEQIYRQFMPYANMIFLTRIDNRFDGDKFFPKVNYEEWTEKHREKGVKDKDNPYDYWHIVLNKN